MDGAPRFQAVAESAQFRPVALRNESLYAGRTSRFRNRLARMGSEHQQVYVRDRLLHLEGGIDAIHHRHRKIEQNDVGFQSGRGRNSLRSVRRLTANAPVVFRVDCPPQGSPHRSAVIDEQNSSLHYDFRVRWVGLFIESFPERHGRSYRLFAVKADRLSVGRFLYPLRRVGRPEALCCIPP